MDLWSKADDVHIDQTLNIRSTGAHPVTDPADVGWAPDEFIVVETSIGVNPGLLRCRGQRAHPVFPLLDGNLGFGCACAWKNGPRIDRAVTHHRRNRLQRLRGTRPVRVLSDLHAVSLRRML